MKRLITAVAGTIAGLIALLSFRIHPGPAAVGSLPVATLGPAAAGTGPSPPPAGPATVTTLGQTVQTQYGTIQVRIVTVRGQIRSVSFTKLVGDEQLSELINAHAAPLLLQRTLTAQSADIHAVSGATYTSDGYRESLQSALDKAARR